MSAPLLFAVFASVAAAAPPVVIDGRFDDWTTVPVAIDDPADAPDAAVDFGTVRVTHDHRFVHLLVELGRTVNVQQLDGSIEILLDVDADTATGRSVHDMPGVDVIVELSPRDPQSTPPAGRGAGIAIPVDDPPPGDRMRLSAHLIGFTYGPTYAGDLFEFRLRRGAVLPGVKSFLGPGRFRARLIFIDRAGRIRDTTETFSHELTPVAPAPAGQPADPLARAPGTDLRVVTWNTGANGLRDRRALFGRLLHALAPDVILFQELTEADDPAELAALLQQSIPAARRQRWSVIIGSGGGRLRCAIASRLTMKKYAPLDPLPLPDRPDRSVRVLGAEITQAGRRLLVVCAHLRCCGKAGSFEDRTRLVEADAIRRAVERAMSSRRFDGVVVGGDLNLVGSRWPLEVLSESLVVVEALQIDGRSNATWADARRPFMPGRLDFMLLSSPSPESRGAFVLDTGDLDQRWLVQHGLGAGDTADASDHMPVVVDLAWE